MPPKKKNNNKKQGSTVAASKNKKNDDEDWEVLLAATTAASETTTATATTEAPEAGAGATKTTGGEAELTTTTTMTNSSSEVATPGTTDAAAAFLAAQGLANNEDGGGATAANKKKKKKKKGAGTGGAEEQPAAPVPAAPKKQSAAGRLVAERLRKQQQEEELRRKLQEEEDRRIEEERLREEEEERLKEEERERKKQKQREKIERQKAEGTYMTKAQKQKAKLAEQRLEAMRAAGMIPTNELNRNADAAAAHDHGTTADAQPQKKKIVYDHKKKKGKGHGKTTQQQPAEGDAKKKDNDDAPDDWEDEADDEEEEEEQGDDKKIGGMATTEPEKERDDENKDDDDAEEWDAESGDDWDASDDDDDDDKFGDLQARLEKVTVSNTDDDEDLIEKEKLAELERLRKIGLKNAERDRIEAEKRALMEAEQKEMDRQAQLIAYKRDEGKRKRLEQEKINLAARSRDDLRCPIVVIMGHVDTGKTTLLDKIRKTNVQEGEAGGITQQIGATYFEQSTLVNQTAKLNVTEKFDIKIPGMLIIDTPGHESFTNLRSRGSSLCDVAILVIDLMHGLEQQTIESLNMLRKREVPFVVALNKVDRCYAWKTCKDTPIRDALKEQPEGTVQEFRSRTQETKVQLMEQGVNSNIYWEMGDDDWENSDFIPLVPTSGVTGEGVQDVLLLLCQMAQKKVWRQLMWCANLQCTVLEVKAIDGLGMTVDCLVVNGYLREGDRAVFCTLDGPVVTEIRGLLTPPPSREMRIKSEYIHHKEIKGALGVKVIGNNLDKVMAGTPVMIVGPDDEEEDIKAEVMSDLTNLEGKLSTDKKGVMVQASTLGALEALLQFLREETKPPIPVSAIGIGTIHKRDVTKISIMNEKGSPEYATILAFDVDIESQAREHAVDMKVRIFTADIIYHLFDQFTRFMEELSEKRRQEAAEVAVFPSIIRILPQHVFNQKDPIIVGVEIVEGILKVGTPLCVPALGGLHVGKITSIESNGREQETAKKGMSVAVKIVNESNPNITYGRQFDASHSLYSTLTRASIDALKENFKDKLETEDWRLVVKLKKVFNIL